VRHFQPDQIALDAIDDGMAKSAHRAPP
jgi:hypothetical protein